MRTILCNRKLEQALLASDGRPWDTIPSSKPETRQRGQRLRRGFGVWATGRLDGRGLCVQDSPAVSKPSPARPKPNARPDRPFAWSELTQRKPARLGAREAQGGFPKPCRTPQMRPLARRTIYNGRGLPRESLRSNLPGLRETINNICHTAVAREIVLLICRPRDDFLKKMSPRRTGLQVPLGCPDARWRRWHGPRPAQDGVDR
jgi:hypothetical protein